MSGSDDIAAGLVRLDALLVRLLAADRALSGAELHRAYRECGRSEMDTLRQALAARQPLPFVNYDLEPQHPFTGP